MAKANTNLMNDIAESLKDSTKNLPKEEKEKVENEVLQEAQQKIENKQKQIEEATSKTSEELNNYANKVEETENSIASSASKLESANEIPKITSTIDLNARNEKIAIKREERKNNSASSNISKTSDTKTVGTSKETNDAKVVETNEIVDKSSTYNIKNTNITAKEKFKEQQLEEKNSKSNTNTTISQNLKNVEKRIDDIDTKNSNNINNSKTSTNLEISSRLGYIPGTELAIQEYSKAASKKIKEAKSVSNANSSTDEVPQQKSVREYLQAGPQWSCSDKSPINGYDVLTGVVAASEGGATFLEDVVKGGAVIGEGLITGGDAVYSLIRSIWDKDALSDFKDRTNQRWDDVGTFISTDYVSNFYEDVIYAGFKDKANHFDTARSIGYSGGYFGAAITSPAKMVSFFAGGDTTVAELSLFEGAAGVLESSVKGVITIEGCNSYFDEKSKKVLSTFLGTNWVGKGFDALYGTKLGKLVKDNVDDFDAKRYIGNTAGSIGTMAAISYFTGGTGAAIVGTLSATGSGTSKALQEGATLEESLQYGTTKGAVTAITFGLSGLGPSKMPTTSGQVIKNAGKGVLKRTILGTIEDAADSALRTLYVPRNKLKELGYESEEEWNNASFLEQTNAYFVDSGGAEGLGKRAATNATYSIALEGAAAIKQINSINKVDKLYNEVTNNTREIDDINNKNRLSKSNSASTSLDDLYAQRQGLADEYKNLNDYEKYLFTLKQTKEAINSGVINTNNFNMDKFIDSGMAKEMYSNLSNQERLALFDAMDEPQIQRYFNQIGGKEARSFVNKNSSYISNRFFNADSASSTWTNSSSLALSSSPSLALGAGVNTKNSSSLMVAYPIQLLPTTKEIGNSNSKIGFQSFTESSKENNSENGIIARNKFESRVGDIEADYNEAIDGIIDEYYTSLRPDVAVPKEKRAISVIQKKYGNNSDYEKTINLYYDELDDSAKKLSDSFLETYTTNYDSPTALTSSLLTKTSASKQQLAKKIEEIDSLIEEFKTKAGYDIFGPHRTNVKVYSGLKEDFMDQYKKVESLESAIKATNKKYVDSVVEKGKELLGESDFEKLDKIFHPQKVEQVPEILEGTAIPRGKKLTTEMAKGRVGVKNSSGSTSKIGFQFFANKKSSGGILSGLFTKKENATDVFFSDFDSKVDTYGTNQEFINNNVRYVINPSNIPFSRSDFYNYLSNKYPDTPLSELKSEWDCLFKGETTITNPNEIVSYLASRNQRLGTTTTKDIDRAIKEFEGMTTKHQSSEYTKLQRFLADKGMTTAEGTNLLTRLDTAGVCSYTDVVNEILTSYKDNPKLFRSQFGYGLYTYTDGKKTLNGNQLLLDLYTYANTNNSGSSSPLFRESSNGILHINSLDTEAQVFLEKDKYKIVDDFLKSKDESLSYNYETKAYKPSLNPDKVKHRIKEALKKGNVGITIFSKDKNEQMALKAGVDLGQDGSTILYDPTGKYKVDTESWSEGEAHSMLVTGYTSKGVIVSSWGKRLVINYEDLANNFYRLRFSSIGGIE